MGGSRLGVSLLGGVGVGIDCCLAMAEPREEEGGVAPSFFSSTSAALRLFLPGGDLSEGSSFFDAEGSGFLYIASGIVILCSAAGQKTNKRKEFSSRITENRRMTEIRHGGTIENQKD